MKLAILNTSIATTDGTYRLRTISTPDALDLVAEAEAGDGWVSYVGHESTRELLSSLLGREIGYSRDQLAQEVGQKALVFKLDGRPKEGVELNLAQLEEIGFALKVMERLA